MLSEQAASIKGSAGRGAPLVLGYGGKSGSHIDVVILGNWRNQTITAQILSPERNIKFIIALVSGIMCLQTSSVSQEDNRG